MEHLKPSDFSHLPEDIQRSPLFSVDLAPVPPKYRTWTTYNFAALWISMAHCIPTYMLAGGLIAVGMNWWQALLTIGLGNLIVLVPILLNSHPGAKYGIPFPVFARASFGTSGTNIAAVLRAIVACGWFGIQSYIGGEAIKAFLVVLWPAFGLLGGDVNVLPGLNVPSAITFMVFWALNIWIIFKGMNAVRVFENWAAPLVLVVAVVLLAWVINRAGGFGPMLDQPSKFTTLNEFWPVFVPSLTAMIGFWATLSLNIPDFTRYGRGQREQILGQVLGLPTTMIFFSAMGVMTTSAALVLFPGTAVSQLWDPVHLVLKILESGMIEGEALRFIVAFLALVSFGIATLSVNIAANVVSPANDFANLAPRHITFKIGGLITGVLGIVIMPWKLLASPDVYIFNWLVGYSALLGPIAGIMIVDYWIIRRTHLDVADLYRPLGRYRGTNPAAVLALILGVAPCVPGFLMDVKLVEGLSPNWSALFKYAWFISFLVASASYMLLSAIFKRPTSADPR